MNMRTRSLYPYAGNLMPVDIFGYASNGIPGIEIVGMGKYGRSMKEKFIFLSREKKLKFPLKRFVLCVEGEIEGKKFKEEEYRFLELPLLLVLWSLTGHLPLSSLDDCFSSGKLTIDGEVIALPLNDKNQIELNDIFNITEEIAFKIIAPMQMAIVEQHYHLPLESLFDSVSNN